MGSKKLKAILLAGSLSIGSADSAAVKELTRQCNAFVPKKDLSVPAWIIALAGRFMSASKRASRLDGIMSLPTLRRWGTTAGDEVCVNNGDTPIRNWTGSRQDYPARAISPALIEKSWRRKYHCYACPLGCGSICENPNDHSEMHRPEYETLAGFGPLLLNTDLDNLFAINEFLNRAGMDSISAGSVVGFALECFEKGILTLQDTGGLDLRWGNSAAILQLVNRMVTRQGIGNLLADGVRVAADKIGRGTERYAMHVGGQELPMHDPKYDSGYGVQYLADPTPGRHTIGSGMTYEMLRLWTKVSWAPEAPRSYPVSDRYVVDHNKGMQSAGCSLAKMVMDGSGLCTFGLQLGVDRFPMFEYLNAVTLPTP
jgi:aldehyde:ferredoxin oxidoreductase